MLALALALVLNQADAGVDAGAAPVSFDAPVYDFCPRTTEQMSVLDGGWALVHTATADTYWIVPGTSLTPPARDQRTRCLLTTCEMSRRVLEQDLSKAPPPISQQLWFAGVGVSFALGALASFVTFGPPDLFGIQKSQKK